MTKKELKIKKLFFPKVILDDIGLQWCKAKINNRNAQMYVVLKNNGDENWSQDKGKQVKDTITNFTISVNTISQAINYCEKYIKTFSLVEGNWTGGYVYVKKNIMAKIGFNGSVEYVSGFKEVDLVYKPFSIQRKFLYLTYDPLYIACMTWDDFLVLGTDCHEFIKYDESIIVQKVYTKYREVLSLNQLENIIKELKKIWRLKI